jgi:putative Mg2+ transporter-C (MgtC) family protein
MNDWGLLGRILLAGLLGYLVGWERHIRGRPAGERTFALLAMGAAAFTVAGVYLAPAEAGRVVAGVATGVGFIGAGLVFRTKPEHIHGLTTAAAVWAVVGLAVLAGFGAYVIAIGGTAAVLLVLESIYIPGLRQLDPARFRHRFRDDESPPSP